MGSIAKIAPSNVGEEDLLACLPQLRSFARYLTRDQDRASDLLQETIAKALKAGHQFQVGTSMKNWMTTIMRNQFYSDLRRGRLQVTTSVDVSEIAAAGRLSQEISLEVLDFSRAFWRLDDSHRRALILVGVGGLSYKAAADAAACATGTMKSRVHRARRELQRTLAQGALGVIQPGTPAMARYVDEVLVNAGTD